MQPWKILKTYKILVEISSERPRHTMYNDIKTALAEMKQVGLMWDPVDISEQCDPKQCFNDAENFFIS
jgi:hypothetical protein